MDMRPKLKVKIKGGAKNNADKEQSGWGVHSKHGQIELGMMLVREKGLTKLMNVG